MTILALALAIRLYGVNSPIVGVHSWRQADTAAISRNFYRNGFDILRPQIDWGGISAGYVECEFPAYQYLVALMYSITGGVHEFSGRSSSAIFSVLSALFFYLCVRAETKDETASLASLLFFAFSPCAVLFGRAFMPEPMMLMCLSGGTYFLIRWSRDGRELDFFLSAAAIALGIMMKLPAAHIGLPLIFLFVRRMGTGFIFTARAWLYASLVLVPAVMWYYHARSLGAESGLTFGIWGYGTDKWGNWGLVVSADFWKFILYDRLTVKFLSFAGVFFALAGFFSVAFANERRLFDWWAAAAFAYLVIVSGGNYNHEYYQLPILFPLSFYAGLGFSAIAAKYSGSVWLKPVLAAMVLFLLSYMAVFYLFSLSSENLEKYDEYPLIVMAKKVCGKDPVVCVDNQNPTLMYLADLKGWHASPLEITPDFVSKISGRGGRYLIGMKSYFEGASGVKRLEEILTRYKKSVIFDNDKFFIMATGGL